MKESTQILEKYKAFDLLNEGVQILDKNWNYLYVNDAVAQQINSTKEKLLSSSLLELYPDVEQTDWFAKLRTCMTLRSDSKIQNEIEHPDGTKTWFDLSIKAIEEGLLILSVDIEESVYNQKFKDCYNELVLKSDDISEVGYWEHVISGQKLYVSDNWLNILGLTRAKFQSTMNDFIKVIHPDDLDRFNEEIEKALVEKLNTPIKLRVVRHNDSAIRHIQLVGQFQFDNDGNIVRNIGFIQDVTETIQARKSEHRIYTLFSSILDQSKDMILSIDKNYLLIEANEIAKKKIKELTGVDIKPGFNMIKDFPKPVEDAWKPYLDRAMDGEQIIANQKGVSTNEEYYTEVSYYPIWEGNEVVEVSVFSRDTTEAVKARKMLELHEKIFKRIITETAQLSGQEYFDKIVLLLTDVLDADYCMLGRRIPNNKVRTLAWCIENEIQDEVEYDLKGTPCDTAMAKSICVIEEEAYLQYPEDELLKEMEVESYIGVPIFDQSKKYIGILNVMFKRIIHDVGFVTSLLEMLSINISFELQRLTNEEEVLKAKDYLENLLDTIKGFVVVFDKDANIKRINKYGLEISEYTEEELLGRNWFETLVPAEKYPDLVNELEYPAPRRIENPILTKSGKELIIEWHNTEIVEDGVATGTISFGLDITQRKLQSKVLSVAMQDRDNFRDALNNSALVSITDTHGQIIYANDKFVEISKYDREELIGQDHRILSSKYHERNFWKEMWASLKAGKSWRREVRNKAKDGSYYWVDTTVNAVFDANGEIYQFMSVRYDITEKKQWEQDLIESENNLKSIFENSAENIISIDSNYRVQAFNERAKKSLKKRFNMNLEKGIYILDHLPDKLKKDAKKGYDIALSGEQYIEERQYKSKNSTLHIETSYSPIFSGNQVTGVAIASRDITDKKFSEEAMQKMDKLNSIGTLAGGIAHDFNNILLGISANISMLQTKLPRDSDGFEYIHESIHAMKRASSLTKQLLTFSKGGEPIIEDVDMSELIEKVVKFDLSGSNVKPKFNFPKDLWMAKVDKGQMQQVISNLTINANQAMSDGGELIVSAENLFVDDKNYPNLEAGQYLKIKITDTGSGIKEDDLELIFDPYFSTKELGHGLGLATTYSIIIKHKGFIKVRSTLGKGTSFTLYLPANSKAKKNKEEQSTLTSSGTKVGGKILIMDDVEMLRKVMSSILKEEGYEVMAVADGEAAVAVYKEQMDNGMSFDAAIMDMTIPGGMGGMEAVAEILKFDPGLKAIASSGYANHQAMSDFKNYGFKDIIVKPYTNDQLLQVLKKTLQN